MSNFGGLASGSTFRRGAAPVSENPEEDYISQFRRTNAGNEPVVDMEEVRLSKTRQQDD